MSIATGAETLAIRPITANRLPKTFDRMRHAPGLQWLGRPMAYALGALVLTILGSGATLLAPRLLEPAAFGTFALLTSLFTYAGRADFGLSQLADKQIPGRANGEALKAGLDILNALWLVGFCLLAMILPLVALFGENVLPKFDTTLAIAGGIMAMIANGPVTLFRASSRIWEFTVVALILQLGMTVPRLVGLLAGGITGSFAALAVYYALCAFLFARPSPIRVRRPMPLLGMARIALPLFAFNLSWILYLGANRWVSATLSSPHDLGLFSLSASLAMIGLGLMSTVAQTRYPRFLARIETGAGSLSADIEQELLAVTGFLAIVAVAAVYAAGPVTAIVFPGYEDSRVPTIALAAACIPLGAMTWVTPMLIIRSVRPVADALLLTIAGLLALAAAMTCGNALAGISGQAWGNAIAALVMFAAMAKLMHGLGMTTSRGWFRIVGFQAFAITLIAVLAFSHAARAETASTQDLIDPPNWKTTFEDDFSRLNLQAASGGVWQPFYPWGGRSNVGNNELQYYVDPRQGGDAPGIQALQPYHIQDGMLAIRATKIPEDLRGRSGGYEYASGLLNSAGRVHFLYGSVQIRAKVPKGRGLWPAFWLLPEDRTWPPELDVLEVLGDDTSTLHVTAHSGIDLPPGKKSVQTGKHIQTEDLSEDFHTYGLTWTKEKLVWSLDGRVVFEAATPADLNKPMFLVVNLAVGGDWPGAPDAETRFPATFLIDWIRVRQPAGDSSRVSKEAIQ